MCKKKSSRSIFEIFGNFGSKLKSLDRINFKIFIKSLKLEIISMIFHCMSILTLRQNFPLPFLLSILDNLLLLC